MPTHGRWCSTMRRASPTFCGTTSTTRCALPIARARCADSWLRRTSNASLWRWSRIATGSSGDDCERRCRHAAGRCGTAAGNATQVCGRGMGGWCMSLQTWLTFCVTETVLCFIPGPAVLFVVSVALARGTRPGLAAATGILIANAFYFALSATGVAAAILASSELFTALRWLGTAYLVWL